MGKKVIDMGKWRLKSCPRCGGDMFIERDLDFWYEQCLQCAYRVELAPLSRFKDAMEVKEEIYDRQVQTEEDAGTQAG
ncbi:hypothetical protein ACFLVU_01225 [Chloroflexota bacterium]